MLASLVLRTTIGGLCASLLVSAGCASTGAVPKPFPTPPAAAIAQAPRPAHAVIPTALKFRGVRYKSGGSDPAGFDCSGFTQYVFAKHGVGLPRSVKEQFAVGVKITPRDIAAGDLLFFATVGSGASHVGIAVSEDSFVHAPSSRGVVRVERFTSDYWTRRFLGARRAAAAVDRKGAVSP
jgi:cell wall-associated NlpC family hydrolase